MSRGQSQPRPQSGRRTLERCKDKGKIDSVVIIDVDNGKSKNESVNVVIVDVPESSQQRFGGSRALRKKKKCPSSVVISIDDEEGCDVEGPRNGDGGGDLDSDATSSKKFRFYPSRSHLSEGLVGNDCQFVREKKFGSRNRFGFNVSESSAYESDSSDCELMEGSSGKIREQWEKAALRRKMSEGVCKSPFGLRDEASASGSNTDPRNSSDEASPKSFEVENNIDNTYCWMAQQSVGPPFYSSSRKASNEKENLSTCTGNGDPIFETEGSNPVAELDKMENQGSCERAGFQDKEEPVSEEPSSCKTQTQDEMQFDHGRADFQEKEPPSSCKTRTRDEMLFDHGRADFEEKEPDPGELSFFGIHFQHDTHINCGSSFQDKDESVPGEPSSCNTPLWDEQQVNDGMACFQDEGEPASGKTFFCNTQSPQDTHVDHERASFQDKHEAYTGKPSSCSTQPWDKTKVNCERAGFQYSGEGLFGKPSSYGTQLQHDSQVNYERASLLHKEKSVFGESSFCNGHGDGMPDLQSDIIGDREKFKETDEYRRAAEEEWASRQQQLQIQAEEAQRLRKRKKAENLRLLDMEKRQKQRVEEMRETQKKDQETINLKEQLRVEVRKELDKLEVKFNDMASLLRGLGIKVGGGPYPLSRDVNAAYKQALLRFHPDRASRSDIRQQVEAEETFKLISRLKEKLPPMA